MAPPDASTAHDDQLPAAMDATPLVKPFTWVGTGCAASFIDTPSPIML
jgi:hypothetical protein